MKPGSVIVDIAAETGGNCEITRPGEIVHHAGVAVHGPINLASSLPLHASQMYSRNLAALVLHLTKNGQLNLDWNDDIVRDTCLVGREQAAPVAAGSGS
jgi:NAD(P) transhydrogenase subunit alpha